MASIVVTHQTIFIHDRDRVLLEVTPRSSGEYRVSRERDRYSLRAGARRAGPSIRPTMPKAGRRTSAR